MHVAIIIIIILLFHTLPRLLVLNNIKSDNIIFSLMQALWYSYSGSSLSGQQYLKRKLSTIMEVMLYQVIAPIIAVLFSLSLMVFLAGFSCHKADKCSQVGQNYVLY